MSGRRSGGGGGGGGDGNGRVPEMFGCDGFRGSEPLSAVGGVSKELHGGGAVGCYDKRKQMNLGHHCLQYMNSHLYPLLATFQSGDRFLGAFMYLPLFHPKSLGSSIYRTVLLMSCESWACNRGEVAWVRACVGCH
jgi:hypothetical protein